MPVNFVTHYFSQPSKTVTHHMSHVTVIQPNIMLKFCNMSRTCYSPIAKHHVSKLVKHHMSHVIQKKGKGKDFSYQVMASQNGNGMVGFHPHFENWHNWDTEKQYVLVQQYITSLMLQSCKKHCMSVNVTAHYISHITIMQ